MKDVYSKSLFIFRRDLRLEDNTGLIFALKSSRFVIPAFIFTPEQIEKNPYRGDPSLQFMIESLEELGESLKEKKGKLYIFFGKPREIVADCIRTHKIDAVIVNRDYTPYSIHRDQKMEAVCKKQGVAFHSFDDALLHPPEITVKEDRKPYTIFSPFFRKAHKIKVQEPVAVHTWNFFSDKIALARDNHIFSHILPERRAQCRGGRTSALKMLKGLRRCEDYSVERDFPALDATTHLSPHLKFTTCSPREVYEAVVKIFGKDSDIIRSLYWRDFFTSICFFFPQVLGASFHKKFDAVSWSYSQRDFDRWEEGTTGFPIVDAGMRELRETGNLHNRVRMIVASFLVKDLHIDWRWGEKYFARMLIDYDPAVNNGNWQWAASTGCDAQPYFRIFNPWIQQKKFDRECTYIKTWIPELKSESEQTIHNWYSQKYRSSMCKYPAPMLDHSIEAKKTLSLYQAHR